jgi:hypothetical protein
MQLAGRDLIALDRVRLGMMGAHVLDEATRDPCQHAVAEWQRFV